MFSGAFLYTLNWNSQKRPHNSYPRPACTDHVASTGTKPSNDRNLICDELAFLATRACWSLLSYSKLWNFYQGQSDSLQGPSCVVVASCFGFQSSDIQRGDFSTLMHFLLLVPAKFLVEVVGKVISAVPMYKVAEENVHVRVKGQTCSE